MVLGAIVMAFGTHLICQNEDIWLLLQEGLAQVMAELPELPCQPNATLRVPMAHLQGCRVQGELFSAATPGLEELRLFRGCLPEGGVEAAWFKINLQQYAASSQEWMPVLHARNLHIAEEVGSGVRIGGFPVSPALARLVPGSIVRLRACDGSAAEPGTELGGRTMQVYGDALYSGDPALLRDGDVRVTFLAGAAREVSVLAAVSDGHLHRWHPPLDGLHALTELPRLGSVAAGSVPAEAMQRSLAPHTQVSFWHLWPLRTMGLLLIWTGMSLLLFPNHVYPNPCGKYCCFRSFPGAFVTTATSACASWCYFRLPTVTTAAVVVLVPLLLALAAGVDVLGWLRRAKDSLSRSSHGSNEHGIPYHVLEATNAVRSSLSRSFRTGAFGVGLGLVVAGPAVQSFALVTYVGDMWEGGKQ